MSLKVLKTDIEEGCEGAAEAMLSWLDAVVTEDIDRLEHILDEKFVMTCDPILKGGRLNKADFMELDRHIRDCKMEVLIFTARRCEDVVVTQIFASVQEKFSGDMGPGMPTAEQLAKHVNKSPIAYADMWHQVQDGSWRCVQHHTFGPIGKYRS